MKIGFVGIGDMGLPMARQLLRAGHEVAVWNRSAEKLAPLVREGAAVASTLPQLANQCELIGICVTSDQIVEQVVFAAGGLLSEGAGSCRGIADFTTGDPHAARSMADRAGRIGVGWVDAPVSGGVPAACTGSLVVFAGGTPEHIERLAPLFEAVASQTTRMGPSGAGQKTKLLNNMVVSTNLAIIAEIFACAGEIGVDPNAITTALAGGWADSLPLQIFGPRMAAGVTSPRLGAIGLMRKDIGLARAMAAEACVGVPMLDRTFEVYSDAIQRRGIGAEGDITMLIDAAKGRRVGV